MKWNNIEAKNMNFEKGSSYNKNNQSCAKQGYIIYMYAPMDWAHLWRFRAKNSYTYMLFLPATFSFWTPEC